MKIILSKNITKIIIFNGYKRCLNNNNIYNKHNNQVYICVLPKKYKMPKKFFFCF